MANEFRTLGIVGMALLGVACEDRTRVSAQIPPEPYSPAWYQQNYGSPNNQYAAACADFTVNLTRAHQRAYDVESYGGNPESDAQYERLVDDAVKAAEHRDALQALHPELDQEQCLANSDRAAQIMRDQ